MTVLKVLCYRYCKVSTTSGGVCTDAGQSSVVEVSVWIADSWTVCNARSPLSSPTVTSACGLVAYTSAAGVSVHAYRCSDGTWSHCYGGCT